MLMWALLIGTLVILLWSSEPYVHVHLEIAVERVRLESAWRSGCMQSDSMI